jgi:hypothetical protein
MPCCRGGLTKAYACGAPTPRALRPTALGAGAPNTGAYCFVNPVLPCSKAAFTLASSALRR